MFAIVKASRPAKHEFLSEYLSASSSVRTIVSRQAGQSFDALVSWGAGSSYTQAHKIGEHSPDQRFLEPAQTMAIPLAPGVPGIPGVPFSPGWPAAPGVPS